VIFIVLVFAKIVEAEIKTGYLLKGLSMGLNESNEISL